MPFKTIFTWFASLGQSNNDKAQSQNYTYGLDNLDDDVIGYPPSPQGIPVVQPQVLLDKMMPQINKMKSELGLTYDEFNEVLLPVMLRWIEYADLLPASEYDHHSTGGGLVYHSFDVALRAMVRAQTTQFPKGIGTMSDTQNSNYHWKVATVLAALLHDGGKVLADMVVSDGNPDPSKEIIWDAHDDQTLNEWAKEHSVERYFIRWNKQRHLKHQNASLMVMQRLIPQKTWSWIDNCYDGKFIHSAMLNAVAKGSVEHPMSRIVAESDSESTREDRYHRNSHITKEVKRIPLSDLMADSIKHKVLTGHFEVNRKGAKVWFVENKLYLIWHSIAPELIQEISDAGYSIPDVPDVLARFMFDDGLVHSSGDKIYLDIYPEILGDKQKPVKLNGLRVTNIERFIHEPDKLYSIKEHQVKKKAPTQSVLVPQEISENLEDHSSSDTEFTGRKQKMFESGIETVSRVLGLMKIRLNKTTSKGNPHLPLQDDSLRRVDDVVIEQQECFYEEEQEAYGNYAQDYADMMNANDELFALPQSTEQFDEAKPHSANQVDDIANVSSKSVSNDTLSCEIANFLYHKLELTLDSGKAILPIELVQQAEDELGNSGINGVTMFNSMTAIKHSKEVVIQ
ncbi:MobH family relaxase [Vibrio splendidus]